MNVNTKLIFLLYAFSLSNPFIEFDKEFLFNNKNNSDKVILNKETILCVDYFKNSDFQNRLNNNLSQAETFIIDYCTCLSQVFYDENFKNNSKSKKNILTEKLLIELFEKWKITSCAIELFNSNQYVNISEKELLNFFLSLSHSQNLIVKTNEKTNFVA